MKLHALKERAWLPGNVVSFYIVPLDPALKGGVKGHLPVKWIRDRIPAYRRQASSMVAIHSSLFSLVHQRGEEREGEHGHVF